MPPGFRIARGWRKRFLDRYGFAAITMPWGVVWVLFEFRRHRGVIAHEQAHLNQIERYGALGFIVAYFWQLFIYGYEHSPFEVEARAAEPDPPSFT